MQQGGESQHGFMDHSALVENYDEMTIQEIEEYVERQREELRKRQELIKESQDLRQQMYQLNIHATKPPKYVPPHKQGGNINTQGSSQNTSAPGTSKATHNVAGKPKQNVQYNMPPQNTNIPQSNPPSRQHDVP